MPYGAKTGSDIKITTTRYDLKFHCTGNNRDINCTLSFEKKSNQPEWTLTFKGKPEEIYGFDIAKVIWDIFNTTDFPDINSLYFEDTAFFKSSSYERILENVLGKVKLTHFLNKK